jgi:mono/diheme cytochrome c family protein
MNRKTLTIAAAVLLCGILTGTTALAQQPPKMPYVFEKNCFLCHKSPERTGPIGIYDMTSKSGNPLHEQYIRNNVRFGLRAMPAFRISEVSPKGLNAIVAYLKDVAEYRKTNRGYKPAPADDEGAQK